MRFLVFDYSSYWSTEPHYFNAALRNIGVESNMWNTNLSVYDNFDTYKPDVFIGHALNLPRDFIQYLKDSNNQEIKVLLNINDINANNIGLLAERLNENNIKFVFFGTRETSTSDIKFIKIMPSADVFIPIAKKKFEIDKAIFVSQEDQIPEYDGVYHILTNNQAIKDKVDIFLPVLELNKLFVNYKEIVFKDASFLESQIVFDAIKNGNKIVFDFKNNSYTDKITEIFKGEKFSSSVKNRHTCFHRLKTLLSQISPPEEILSRLNDRINSL
jgi:hypothetical protein